MKIDSVGALLGNMQGYVLTKKNCYNLLVLFILAYLVVDTLGQDSNGDNNNNTANSFTGENGEVSDTHNSSTSDEKIKKKTRTTPCETPSWRNNCVVVSTTNKREEVTLSNDTEYRMESTHNHGVFSFNAYAGSNTDNFFVTIDMPLNYIDEFSTIQIEAFDGTNGTLWINVPKLSKQEQLGLRGISADRIIESGFDDYVEQDVSPDFFIGSSQHNDEENLVIMMSELTIELQGVAQVIVNFTDTVTPKDSPLSVVVMGKLQCADVFLFGGTSEDSITILENTKLESHLLVKSGSVKVSAGQVTYLNGTVLVGGNQSALHLEAFGRPVAINSAGCVSMAPQLSLSSSSSSDYKPSAWVDFITREYLDIDPSFIQYQCDIIATELLSVSVGGAQIIEGYGLCEITSNLITLTPNANINLNIPMSDSVTITGTTLRLKKKSGSYFEIEAATGSLLTLAGENLYSSYDEETPVDVHVDVDFAASLAPSPVEWSFTPNNGQTRLISFIGDVCKASFDYDPNFRYHLHFSNSALEYDGRVLHGSVHEVLTSKVQILTNISNFTIPLPYVQDVYNESAAAAWMRRIINLNDTSFSINVSNDSYSSQQLSMSFTSSIEPVLNVSIIDGTNDLNINNNALPATIMLSQAATLNPMSDDADGEGILVSVATSDDGSSWGVEYLADHSALHFTSSNTQSVSIDKECQAIVPDITCWRGLLMASSSAGLFENYTTLTPKCSNSDSFDVSDESHRSNRSKLLIIVENGSYLRCDSFYHHNSSQWTSIAPSCESWGKTPRVWMLWFVYIYFGCIVLWSLWAAGPSKSMYVRRTATHASGCTNVCKNVCGQKHGYEKPRALEWKPMVPATLLLVPVLSMFRHVALDGSVPLEIAALEYASGRLVSLEDWLEDVGRLQPWILELVFFSFGMVGFILYLLFKCCHRKMNSSSSTRCCLSDPANDQNSDQTITINDNRSKNKFLCFRRMCRSSQLWFGSRIFTQIFIFLVPSLLWASALDPTQPILYVFLVTIGALLLVYPSVYLWQVIVGVHFMDLIGGIILILSIAAASISGPYLVNCGKHYITIVAQVIVIAGAVGACIDCSAQVFWLSRADNEFGKCSRLSCLRTNICCGFLLFGFVLYLTGGTLFLTTQLSNPTQTVRVITCQACWLIGGVVLDTLRAVLLHYQSRVRQVKRLRKSLKKMSLMQPLLDVTDITSNNLDMIECGCGKDDPSMRYGDNFVGDSVCDGDGDGVGDVYNGNDNNNSSNYTTYNNDNDDVDADDDDGISDRHNVNFSLLVDTPSFHHSRKQIDAASPIMTLFAAAKKGFVTQAEFFVEEQIQQGIVVDLDEVDDSGITALCHACRKGHVHFVDWLLARGADPQCSLHDGTSPLHLASEAVAHAAHVAVATLIRSKAHVNSRTNNGLTPLAFAAGKGNLRVMQLLIEARASIDFKSVSPSYLIPAVQDDHCNRNLHQQQQQHHHQQHQQHHHQQQQQFPAALHVAAQNGWDKVVSFLLRMDANVNVTMENNVTPLFYSTSKGHEKVTDILLQNKAKVNSQRADNGETPLHAAATHGHAQLVSLLLHYKATLDHRNSFGFSAMLMACQRGHVQVVCALMDRFDNISSTMALSHSSEAAPTPTNPLHDVHRTAGSPLLLSILNAHANVLRELLKRQADVNYQHPDGTTSLLVASQNGDTTAIQLLLDHKARVDLARRGLTPLGGAAFLGVAKAVDLLLRAKSNINIQTDPRGLTPLMLACGRGHKNVARLLLQAGANAEITSMDNETAESLAKKEHNALAKWLNIVKHFNSIHWICASGNASLLKQALQSDSTSTNMIIARQRNTATVTPLELLSNRQSFKRILHLSNLTSTEITKMISMLEDARVCWTPRSHYIWPHSSTPFITTLLCLAQRRSEIPMVVWYRIAGFAISRPADQQHQL